MAKKKNLTFLDETGEEALFSGKIEGIVAICHANERPLQGLAGQLDWRFHGQISNYVREGAIHGEPGECTYLPIKKNDRTFHLFLAGGGFTEAPGTRNRLPQETMEKLKQNLKKLGLKQMGLSDADFGHAGREFFESELEGIDACILQ